MGVFQPTASLGLVLTSSPIPHVLEQRGWLGLEEVMWLSNSNKSAVSGTEEVEMAPEYV